MDHCVIVITRKVKILNVRRYSNLWFLNNWENNERTIYTWQGVRVKQVIKVRTSIKTILFPLNIVQLLKCSTSKFFCSSVVKFRDQFHTRGPDHEFAGHIFSWVPNHRPWPGVRRGPWRPETETESPGSRGPGPGVTLLPEPEPRGDQRPSQRKPGLRDNIETGAVITGYGESDGVGDPEEIMNNG